MKSRFRVIDSHTGGEPTRTIVEGGPLLVGDSLAELLTDMRDHNDGFRKAIVNEPRGSEVMVGAYLVPPRDPSNHCGIIFFNNVDYLGMCGHGTIGVVATLYHMGQLAPGTYRFETVAGIVTTTLNDDLTVTVENVPSYRAHSNVGMHIDGMGQIQADIAYGGNWFCLVSLPNDNPMNQPIQELLLQAKRILEVCRQSFPEVDHVELFGTPSSTLADSRNFVLCPGGMYDRSPCGTGTSAKLACLAADGKLGPDEPWIQESIIGSTFEGKYRWVDQAKGIIVPSITGRAHVNADVQVIVDDHDPFAWGLTTFE